MTRRKKLGAWEELRQETQGVGNGVKRRENGGRLWGEEKGLARGHDVKNKEQGMQLTKC